MTCEQFSRCTARGRARCSSQYRSCTDLRRSLRCALRPGPRWPRLRSKRSGREAAARDRIFDRAHARGVRHQRRARHDRHRRRRHTRRRRRVRAAASFTSSVTRSPKGRAPWHRRTGGSTTSPSTPCASTPVCGSARIWRIASGCARRWRRPPTTARTTTRSPPIRWRLMGIRRRRSRSRRANGSTLRPGARRSRRRSRERRCSRGPRHPLGFPWGPAAETCGGCAWLYVGGRGAPVARCRQARADGGRRRADRAGASRLRALGAARRLPALRGLLPRGLSLGHRLGARSGRLEGARPDRARGPPLRDPPRRGALRGAEGRCSRARRRATPARSTRTGPAPVASSRPAGGIASTPVAASGSP